MADHVEIHVVGCGDAFGSGGQFQTCFLLRDAYGTLAIDFGASSLIALRARGQDPDSIDEVLLTHFHGDHMAGLPFLLLDREFGAGPVQPLTIHGPPGLRQRLRDLTEAMFPGTWRDTWRFPLTLSEITPGDPARIGNRSLRSVAVNHATGPYTATAVRIETCGKVVAFSGDTGWVDALLDIAADSDLFICECYSFEVQPFTGHISLPVLLQNLPRLRTRRLMLSHLGAEMMANRAALPVECLTDGATYRV